jgi:AMMECR1 domain-containing protein
MNLSFWKQVQTNWQSVQLDAIEAAVDLKLFRNVLLQDIANVKEAVAVAETPLELANDDEFWGGF